MTDAPAARLAEGAGFVRRGAPAPFFVDDAPAEGIEGESLMAALLRHGGPSFRRTRLGTPRGPFCGMGVCHDCLVEADGRRSQRACRVKLAAGMRVRRAEELAPIVAPLAERPGTLRERSVPLVIVGAGPAGLAAAETAARHGVEALVLDEAARPGGQYLKQPSAAHGFRGAATDAQYALGETLVARVRRQGAEIWSDATVWGARPLGPQGIELDVLVGAEPWRLRARALVLATGAIERAWPVPGWTLPGVMTTGCVQTLLRADRTMPGGRVVVAGHGPLNLQLAYELSRAGATVAAVVEASSPTSPRGMGPLAEMARTAPGLLGDGMRYLVGLRRAGIFVCQGHVLVGVEGADRAEAARIARLDGEGRVVPGSEQRLEADTICLSYGFQPASELSRLLGCRHRIDPATGAPVPEQQKNGATSVEGVWIAGDGGAIGGARVALAQGRLAALAALESLGRDVDPSETEKARRDLDLARRFQQALWTLFCASPLDPIRLVEDADPIVCRCEEVRLAEVRRHLGRWSDAGALKRLTRIGMGRCQGRYCAPILARLLGDAGEGAGFAPQRPARPVPAMALLREQGEWTGHPAVTPRPPLASAGPDEPIDLRAEVAVIGAGILGVATALALAERGVETVLVERGQPNGQASGGNAGSLHVQLLAYDLKDRERIAEQPVASLLPLQRHATRVWQEIEQSLGVDLEIEVTGGLMLAESEEQLRFLERKAAVERAHGIEVAILGRDELRRIFPDVAAGMVGASLCPAEGKINPLLATPALLAAAQARGVRLVTRAAVEAIETLEPGFCLRTSRGTVRQAPRRCRRRRRRSHRGTGRRASARARRTLADARDRGRTAGGPATSWPTPTGISR